ncbi:MAG: hypothetical protein RL085_761 [Actinomycetota bacterium]|jgi:L-ascorbate metabolism protein UlaG (beta-lactamase superfamily)
MKITKLEHATLVLEQGGDTAVIDPGVYTRPLTGLSNVRAIVMTHMHDDHCFEEQLDRILADNLDALLFGTDDVRKRLAESRPNLKVTSVHHGDFHKVGEFTFEFLGDMHKEIHHSIALIQNCGVMVNDLLYYPGDSFTRPDRKVALLACPSSAPWAKVGEIMDFVDEVKPARSFGTHNIHLSAEGHQMYNGRIKQVTEKHGGTFEHLEPGDSTEI